MKRVKEAYYQDHPAWVERETISGCREFDGEDLKYDARREFFKIKQKQWLQLQMKQKKQKEARQKHEEQLYAQQTFQHTRMIGVLQDDFHKKKENMVIDLKKQNKILENERKQKERVQKEARLKHEQEEANYHKVRGVKQGFNMNII